MTQGITIDAPDERDDTVAKIDWRTISALNVLDTLAQVGQFGIGFIVLPLWVTQRGLNSVEQGLLGSALYLGMLIGIIITPRLMAYIGVRRIIAAALILSTLALAMMPFFPQKFWILAALLLGCGLGLRWIALEPWLYQIAPEKARGRLIGLHETLIALSMIIAPPLAVLVGIESDAPFYLGMGFSLAALIPLALTRPYQAPDYHPDKQARRDWGGGLFQLGLCIALVGGIIDAGFTGLFPLFGDMKGWSAAQIAVLLTIEGIGGVLLQYITGWLADHRGLTFATAVSSGMTALSAIALLFPIGLIGAAIALFILGGGLTAFLTLALIGAAAPSPRPMALNVSRISVAFTASAVFGPISIGLGTEILGPRMLVFEIAGLSMVLLGLLWVGRQRFLREASH